MPRHALVTIISKYCEVQYYIWRCQCKISFGDAISNAISDDSVRHAVILRAFWRGHTVTGGWLTSDKSQLLAVKNMEADSKLR